MSEKKPAVVLLDEHSAYIQPPAEPESETQAPPKKKKKKHLRLWVRITLAAIAAVAAFLLFMYIMTGAILQESYKLNPPTQEEVVETMEGAHLYKWLIAPYAEDNK